jgi:hypothetical protein
VSHCNPYFGNRIQRFNTAKVKASIEVLSVFPDCFNAAGG